MIIKDKDEDQRKKIKKVFEKCGINSLLTKNISLSHTKTEIDVLGVYKNVLILTECVGSSDSIGKKTKKFITDSNILIQNLKELIEILKKDYTKFFEENKDGFRDVNLIRAKKLLVDLNKECKEEIEGYILKLCNEKDIKILTREEYFYFDIVANTEDVYGKYRIFEFLDIKPEDILKESIESPLIYIGVGSEINGLYDVINLSIPVSLLLKRVTIKRLQDWNSEGFQRLLDMKKLQEMRKYLKEELKIYPTNIVLLANKNPTIEPISSHLVEFKLEQDKSIIPDIKRNMEGHLFLVKLPNTYDAFLIIDGQHRLFSYAQMDGLKDMHMLVTMIAVKEDSRILTGPKLFYDINQKQTYIKSEDIIDLERILHPSSPIVKANELLEKLNKNGVLKDKIKFKPWQDERIKRVSLISYSGVRDIFNESKKSYKIFYEHIKSRQKYKIMSIFVIF